MEKKYPIGGYAPGNYQCKCCRCGKQFVGDKRAVECEPCALISKELFDALPPAEQQALVANNATIANYMLSGPLSPERELIYRIVEQWGNAIEMPNMEGWLKEYAAKHAPTGAVWVKATSRLPEKNGIYKVKREFYREDESDQADFLNGVFTNYQGYRVVAWLDESGACDAADRVQAINLSDIDAPIFTHTKEFAAHFSYIKGKIIEILKR